MSFGKGLNAWREEWEASEELRFQFPLWNDYAYRCLGDHWAASPEQQRRFGGDYNAFMSAAKKDASVAFLAAQNKADAATRKTDEQANSKTGILSQFTRHKFRRS